MDMTTPMQPKPLVNATCKLGEKGCFKDGRCHALGDCENKVVTNADRIRAMNDDDLRNFLCGLMNCSGCVFGSSSGCTLKDWLQMPSKED